MDSVQHKLLFLVLFSAGLMSEAKEINARMSEEICEKLTKRPFFNYDYVFGKWRPYYTWGLKLRRCESIRIKTVSDSTKDRFADAVRDYIVVEPDWYDAEMLVIFGNRITEHLLFPEGEVRGRFRALTNVRRIDLQTPPHHTMRYTKYAFKAFIFFKYLAMINCSQFSGYLMARPNDTTVSVKEIMMVVDSMNLRVEGEFACLP